MPKRKRAHWNDLDRLRHADNLRAPKRNFKRIVLENAVEVMKKACNGNVSEILDFVKKKLNDPTAQDTEILNSIIETSSEVSRKLDEQAYYNVTILT